MRLHRRAARRIDQQRDRARARPREGALERLCHRGERQARPQRRGEADDAGEPHHRHDRNIAAKPARQHGLEKVRGPFEEIRLGHPSGHMPHCCAPLKTGSAACAPPRRMASACGARFASASLRSAAGTGRAARALPLTARTSTRIAAAVRLRDGSARPRCRRIPRSAASTSANPSARQISVRVPCGVEQRYARSTHLRERIVRGDMGEAARPDPARHSVAPDR